MNATNGGFLPDSYEAPVSGGFSKLEQGDNRFRILSSPLLVWLIWEGGKVSRAPYLDSIGKITDKPVKGTGEKDSVKHAWEVKAYNYKTKQLEVLELDQVGIIASLTKHSNDPEWGHPNTYDIVIGKTGSGMETKYTFLAKPHKEVGQEIKDAWDATPIDLDELMKPGGNPFIQSGGTPASTPAAPPVKVVTPENWVKGDPVPTGYKSNLTFDGIEKEGNRPF